MVEHVRRRALLSKKLSKIYVATCDSLISNTLQKYNVKTIKTSNKHKNGTSRVAEAIKGIRCTHVILLQGDEPLLLPSYVDLLCDRIMENPSTDSWNLTAPISKKNQFADKSIVKCKLNKKKEIISLYRSTNNKKIKNIRNNRKILGIIAYKKNFLLKLVKLKESKNELKNFIEQARIIDNNYTLKSINVPKTLPSINLKKDERIVKNIFKKNLKQKILLNKILNLDV